MADKKYNEFPDGAYDSNKIILQADPETGALEKISLPKQTWELPYTSDLVSKIIQIWNASDEVYEQAEVPRSSPSHVCFFNLNQHPDESLSYQIRANEISEISSFERIDPGTFELIFENSQIDVTNTIITFMHWNDTTTRMHCSQCDDASIIIQSLDETGTPQDFLLYDTKMFIQRMGGF